MKNIIIGLLLVLATGVWADDVTISAPAPYTERGVSITKWVDGSELRLESLDEPWFPTSIMVLGSDAITNTVSLSVARIFAFTNQTSSVISTNFIGLVETNAVETNVTWRVTTGTVYSATVTGNVLKAITPEFQFKAGDTIIIGQTDTVGKPVIISGRR